MARIRGYLQGSAERSTLDCLEKAVARVSPDRALFCFAYCTSSGFGAFHNRLGGHFWDIDSRWLFGIDYGRSQPTALRDIAAKPNATVRVHDGVQVVQRAGFFPRQDFHLKACFLHNRCTGASAMLAGSGNFSLNGLSRSIECGVLITTRTEEDHRKLVRPVWRAAERLWNRADPLDQLLDDYVDLWTPGIAPPSADAPSSAALVRGDYARFWIEVGYVTPNRGGREGNQFDMPRGVHAFFGLRTAANQVANSKIGDVTFVGNGIPLTRALRLGNNLMEKLTLPIPENLAFRTYSGKILEFTRVPGGFAINAYELDEFERLLRQSPSAVTLKMGSGRTYGYR